MSVIIGTVVIGMLRVVAMATVVVLLLLGIVMAAVLVITGSGIWEIKNKFGVWKFGIQFHMEQTIHSAQNMKLPCYFFCHKKTFHKFLIVVM